jgi:hypothetical protein
MSRSPRHRATTTLRDLRGEVVYLMGRIGLVVLLLIVAIVLMVGAIVLAGWIFVVIIQGYVGS